MSMNEKGEQGWRSGESAVVRALASHQCDPGLILGQNLVASQNLVIIFTNKLSYREQVRLAFFVENSVMWKGKFLELSCVTTQQ